MAHRADTTKEDRHDHADARPPGADDRRPKVRYITKIDKLDKLTNDERKALQPVADRYAFRLNDYYAELIDWNDPDDPIRQLVVPRADELDEYGKLDASDEDANTVHRGGPAQVRRHRTAPLQRGVRRLLPVCFRKRLFMNDNDEATNDVSAGMAYIRENEQITNVLLTGGDPLLMSTRRLTEIIDGLARIPHVRIVRIGSKMPAFDPWRLRRDRDLRTLFRRYATGTTRIYLMAHFDHPRELTPEAVSELEAYQECGVTCVNQCPLIRGINDDPDVLAEMWEKLSFAGCPPYYLFQGRPTAGNSPYEVPITAGLDIFQQALTNGSGLARRARYVMSHATGKIEIMASDAESIYLRYHQAKDPNDLGRMLIARRDDKAAWLDDLEWRDWTRAGAPLAASRPRQAADPAEVH